MAQTYGTLVAGHKRADTDAVYCEAYRLSDGSLINVWLMSQFDATSAVEAYQTVAEHALGFDDNLRWYKELVEVAPD